MGKDKQTTETRTETRQQAQPTAEERRLNELALQQRERLSPLETQLGEQAINTISGILGGGGGLPDVFQSIFTGITPELTQEFAREAIADIAPQFQQAGVLDSGAAAAIAGRTAGDIRRASAESNLARRFNLLNLGLDFGGQQQQLGTQAQNVLGSQLAGLRTMTGTNNQSQTTIGMNPFMRSFQQGLGSGLGSLGTSMFSGFGSGLSGMFSGGGGMLTPMSTGFNPPTMSQLSRPGATTIIRPGR